jgi:hypothetical protein
VYALIGFVFTFCFFPYLSAAGLFHTSLNNGYITYVAVLNMYLALGAGVLGCFAACTFSYRKIQTFDLIYTGLNVYYFLFREVLLLVLQLIYIIIQRFQ